MYNPPLEEFYFLKIKNMWRYFKGQHFSFWMICAYLFFEYSRPQSIFPVIDFLPWAQLFLIGSLIGAFMDPTVKWVSSPVNKFITLFALVIFISSLNAYYPEISREHYIDFYGWFVIYFLIITIVNTKQRFYIFLLIFILCAAKISVGTSRTWVVRGLSFTDWGLMGPPGYFQNSGELSILMLTLFPLVYLLYGFLKDKVSKLEKYLLILFWVTPVLTILGASSRGAQIALLIQMIFLFRKEIFKFKKLIGIIFLALSLYQVLPEEQKQRFSSAGEDKTSQQRLLYWKHGMEMIKSHPWFGVGYFNFPQYYEDHFSQDLLYPRAQLPHNIFIQVASEIGTVGLFLFIMMIIISFRLAVKLVSVTEESLLTVMINGIALGIAGYTIAGQFVSVAYYPFFWVSIAFLISVGNIQKTSFKKNVDNNHWDLEMS